MWIRKSKNEGLATLSAEQLLADAELMLPEGITFAALILLGTPKALSMLLPQAEVIFEYRSTRAPGPAQQRVDYRRGFFLFYEDIWNTIDLRNDIQSYQDGLFMWDVPTFSEATVREAILNAITHRDYRLNGSVFIREFARELEVVSPGGFPPGVTADNIIWKQSSRNRRIAEVLQKCAPVERSGQGADRMFEECIRQGKPLPDYSRSDNHEVFLTLRGNVQDASFLRFLEKAAKETKRPFGIEDLLLLDMICRDQPIPQDLKPRLRVLAEEGTVEVIGRGRGARYLLGREYYALAGKRGAYTRRRGLDRETNKELLLKHIQDSSATGSRLGELTQVLPALSGNQVRTLLQELKGEGRIHPIGRTRGARWFPGPTGEPSAGK